MRSAIKYFIPLLFALVSNVSAQDVDSTYSVDELFSVSMEELLSLKVESASKKEESSLETPLSVTVLTADEIMNSGATTIEEAFRLVPGMIVRQESNGNYDVHIRGLDNIPSSKFTFYSENTMSLVLLDGQKMYNHINGGTWWETFPISVNDIAKIEVIRGPSTALYGPNAATGVINIITKEVKEEGVGVTGVIQSGMHSTSVGSASVTYKKKKLSVRASANFDFRNRFETSYYDFYTQRYTGWDSLNDYTNGQQLSNVSQYSRWGDEQFSKKKIGVYSAVDYQFSDSISTTLYLSSQSSDAKTVFMENTHTPYGNRVSNVSAIGVFTQIKDFDIQLNHQIGQQDIAKGNNSQRPFDLNISDVVVEYQKNIADKVLFQPGVSFQQATYNDLPNIGEGQRGVLNAKHALKNIAYYLRAEYHPLTSLRFIAAIRGDKYETPDTTYLSWQLGMTYDLSQHSIIRYVFSKANRGPFISDVFTNYTDFSAGVINFNGNPEIKLASIMQHEIGFRSKINDDLSLDLELFTSLSKDYSGLESEFFTVLDPATGAIQSDFVYNNYSVEAMQLGATAMMTYRVNKDFGIKGFVTIQETRVKDVQIYDSSIPFFIRQDPIIEDGFHKNTPTCYGGLIVDYKLSPKFLVNTNMYFYSSQLYQYRIDETDVPSNMIWNLVLKYNILDDHILFLNARNAFNTNKREFGFVDRSQALLMFGIELKF